MDREADLIGWLADDIDGDAGRCRDALCSISCIGKGQLDKWEAATRGFEQWNGAIVSTMACRLRPSTFFPAS
jgi:hypothetical protein